MVQYDPSINEELEDNKRMELDLIEMTQLKNALCKGESPWIRWDKLGITEMWCIMLRTHWRMLYLFNTCWSQSAIPDEWKIAKVISMFKKGKRDDTLNYQGISLLNAPCKIYSKVINERLCNIIDTILFEEHEGFLKERSCIDGVFCWKQIFLKQ